MTGFATRRGALAVAVLATGIWSCRDAPPPEQAPAGSDSAPRASTPASPDSVMPPATPAAEYVRRGACPFECCRYGRWQLETTATLKARPDESAPAVGVLASGDSILADSGLVALDPVGLLLITGAAPSSPPMDPVPFKPGDTVYVLDYIGEGYRRVRWRGQELEVTEYWTMQGDRGARLLRAPVQKWWVHATAGDRKGWMLMTNVRVQGADACA